MAAINLKYTYTCEYYNNHLSMFLLSFISIISLNINLLLRTAL